MQIPPAFSDEIGNLPGRQSLSNDWHTAKLGDLVRMVSGGTPSMSNPTLWGGDTPWLSAKDLKSFRLSTAQMNVTEQGANAGTRLVPKNTIVMLVRGMTLLKDVPIGITTRPMTFNQDLKALIVGEEVSPAFLAYWLVSRKSLMMSLVDRAGHGTGRLPTELLCSVDVCFPPLPEQHRIVEVLDVADAAVRTTEKLIAAKVKYKNAVAEQLLTGKRRFPEFAGQEWHDYHLADLFTERVEMNRPDLKLLAVTGTEGIVDRNQLVKRDTSSEDKSKYLRVVPGDIAYNTMRMWQGVFGLSALEGIVSPAYTVCTPKEQIEGRFAAYFFKLPAQIDKFRRYSQGLVSDTWNLKFPAFAKIRVTIPDVSEQRRIADVLELMDQEIALLKRQLTARKAQKAGLMQKLLTGQVRVGTEATQD